MLIVNWPALIKNGSGSIYGLLENFQIFLSTHQSAGLLFRERS